MSKSRERLVAKVERALTRLDEQIWDEDDLLGIDKKLDALAEQMDRLLDAVGYADPIINPNEPYLVYVLRRLSQRDADLESYCNQVERLYAYAHAEEYGACLLDPEDVADASASCADLYSVFDSVLDEFRQ